MVPSRPHPPLCNNNNKCSVGSHDIDDGGRGFHDNSFRPYIRAHWREVLCGKI